MFSGGLRLVQTLFLKGDSPSTHGLDQWVLVYLLLRIESALG